MFTHPHVCLDTPICLDALHISECPPVWHHAPLYICMFLGVSVYDMGMGASIYPILSAQMLFQGQHTKSIIDLYMLGKHKYLNKTPYDLYELFTCLSKGGLGGV